MNKNQSLAFQSLHGFRELIIKKTTMFEKLREIFDFMQNFEFNENVRKEYKKFRFLDTFFSDSFPRDLLDDIVETSNYKNCSIEILLLDPFSELAISRANALGTSPILEINTTLSYIREAIYKLNGHDNTIGVELAKNGTKIEFLEKQFDEVKSLGNGVNLSVRFYNAVTDAPVYLIGTFVAKGQLLYRSSAANNPWLIFVDDPSQNNDMYDSESKNFDKIWKIAKDKVEAKKARAMPNRNVFISHGRNQTIKHIIVEEVKKLGFTPILFENEASKGIGIFENLKAITQKCSYGIIIMTKEDLIANKEIRTRQNVIHELGFCQALYGQSKVLPVIEQGIENLSNIAGILSTYFDHNNISSISNDLAKFLK